MPQPHFRFHVICLQITLFLGTTGTNNKTYFTTRAPLKEEENWKDGSFLNEDRAKVIKKIMDKPEELSLG